MTEKQYRRPSYRDILMCRIIHKYSIIKVNTLIKESQSRYSKIKYNKEYDYTPHWGFSIYDSKLLQIQCINCSICGEYIQNSDCDVSKLLPQLLCKVLDHHDNAKYSERILAIKQFLRYFDQSGYKPYLYKASLLAVIVADRRLNIFFDIFTEYIGISFLF